MTSFGTLRAYLRERLPRSYTTQRSQSPGAQRVFVSHNIPALLTGDEQIQITVPVHVNGEREEQQTAFLK